MSLKSKKLNNFHYEEKSFIHKKSTENPISGYQKFDIVENKNFIKFYFLLGDKKIKFIKNLITALKRILFLGTFVKKIPTKRT